MSKIGQNIRKIRGVKKINQTDFANLISISRASVGAYEEGRAEPKIETIIKISEHFKIPVDHLLKTEIQVNDIINFNLSNSKLDFSQPNLTKGKKINLKEIPLVSKPNSKKKPQLITVPVMDIKKKYTAILNKGKSVHIFITYESTDLEHVVNLPVFIQIGNEFKAETIVADANSFSIKGSGENITQGQIVYVVESEFNQTSTPSNLSMEERITNLEKKIFTSS